MKNRISKITLILVIVAFTPLMGVNAQGIMTDLETETFPEAKTNIAESSMPSISVNINTPYYPEKASIKSPLLTNNLKTNYTENQLQNCVSKTKKSEPYYEQWWWTFPGQLPVCFDYCALDYCCKITIVVKKHS